jgi:ribose 5-phosphate isomerase B
LKIAIGADHGGYRLKETIKKMLIDLGHEVDDFGCHGAESVDYPDYAGPVARKVAQGEYERGILICGTGIGMSIAANKVQGIRCALAHDPYSAKMTRLHNDSNVLALGERVIGPGVAEEIVKIWLDTPFEGGRHTRRLEKICALEPDPQGS